MLNRKLFGWFARLALILVLGRVPVLGANYSAGYHLVTYPYGVGGGTTLTSMMDNSTVPSGTTIYTFDTANSGYTASQFIDLGFIKSWMPEVNVAPGEGFYVASPSAFQFQPNHAAFTGNNALNIKRGKLALLGHQRPSKERFETILGGQPPNNFYVFKLATASPTVPPHPPTPVNSDGIVGNNSSNFHAFLYYDGNWVPQFSSTDPGDLDPTAESMEGFWGYHPNGPLVESVQGQTGPGAPVRVTFDQRIHQLTASATSSYLIDGGAVAISAVNVAADLLSVDLVLASDLKPGTDHVLTMVKLRTEANVASEIEGADFPFSQGGAPGPGPGVGQPDLSVRILNRTFDGANADEVCPGDQVGARMALSVDNLGKGAVGAFSYGFYLSSDAQITTSDHLLIGGQHTFNAGLGANQSVVLPITATMAIPGGIAPGNYFIGVLLDDMGAIVETDETNNTQALPVVVDCGVDLAVRILNRTFDGANADEVCPGDQVGSRMALSVDNLGKGAVGAFSYGFYLSSDAQITTSDHLLVGGREFYNAGLGGNQNVNLPILPNMSIPLGLPAGNYYIGVIVDELAQIAETDENNNTAAWPVKLCSTGPIASMNVIPGWPYLAFDGQGALTEGAISPFAAIVDSFEYFELETFESADRQLTAPGLVVESGRVLNGAVDVNVDSVDNDDASIDGDGGAGGSLFHDERIVFSFDKTVLGTLPTHVGLVWTDGAAGAEFTFEVFDRSGERIMALVKVFGDESYAGTTDEDAFIGFTHPGGIAQVVVSDSVDTVGFEIDHIQYGTWSAGFEVIEPETPAVELMLNMARDGSNLVVTFTGDLHASMDVTGPFVAIPMATSPYTVTPTGNQRFFRVFPSVKPSSQALCLREPGFPGTGFNQCSQSMKWDLISSASPEAKHFAVTGRHAIWWDTFSPPIHSALFFATHSGDKMIPPSPVTMITGSTGTESVDAISDIGDPGVSYVYFDGSGDPLGGVQLGANSTFVPTFNVMANQEQPGGNDLPNGFVWEEAGDIYRSSSVSETPTLPGTIPTITAITQTPDLDRRPRAYGDAVVWENESTGEVLYVPSQGAPVVHIDHGARPDIHGDWIVYEKEEPAPDPACSWASHTQIWAYGPLSGQPTTLRISSVPYWGAANYRMPRLSQDYVVCLVDYIHVKKTVIGIYPVAAFGSGVVPMQEVDDDGDGAGNVDIWQEPGSREAYVLYRALSTGSARLSYCMP